MNDEMEIKIKVPGRVCLLGDKTDLLGRPVIAMAVSCTLDLCMIPRIDTIVVFTSKNIQQQKQEQQQHDHLGTIRFDLSDIPQDDHPLKYWYGILYRLRHRITHGFEAILDSSIPMGAGLSSSAAISIALTRGLNELFHLGLTTNEIAEISYQSEREDLGIACGRMDQFSIAHGGVTFIETGEHPQVTHLTLPTKTLPIVVGDSLEDRNAKDVLNRIQEQIDAKDRIVLDAIDIVCQGVLEGRDALLLGDYTRIGQLMCQQQCMENVLQASTPKLNIMCKAAIEAGALGAKLTGAGGGGCMLALCPNKIDEVVHAIKSVGGRAWVFDIFEY